SNDAWLFWNMRARFLFRAGEHWRDAFLPHIVNPSYPLMLPSAIAAIWSSLGKEWMFIPKWVAAGYTVATVALLGGVLALVRGTTQALIAVIAVLSLSSFIIRGASQVSDVPLGFYFLATLASLSLYDRLPQKNARLLVLAGAMAGFSAWTKNEGLLFVLVLVLSRSLTVLLFRGWKTALKEMAFLGAGLAPVLSVILYFKWNIAAPNDLVAAAKDSSFVLEKVSTASRYGEISVFYLKTLFLSGSVTWLNPLVYLIAFALIFKVRILPEFKLNILFTATVLASMLAGYYVVHLLVPYDLHFYLEHSLTRLLIQLWPSFLLLFFTAVRNPEEARQKA
ncbi:MAG TPA: hypothetical protein VFW62_13630, partial [bacterium]|nr:hypothetical protein [bacterium]